MFRKHEAAVSTLQLSKGLSSDQVLAVLRDDLLQLEFLVERGKEKAQKIGRPVFFGENGEPTLKYEVDAYHPVWRCGLEVEAGRAWMGNAVYRDMILALVMVDVDHLMLAVPNAYRYKSGGREVSSSDFDNTVSVAETLFGHRRFSFPYGLTVIGY